MTPLPRTWESAVRSLIDDPAQRQVVLDCYYDQPLEAAVARYLGSDEWRAIQDLLPSSGGKALDIGAGHGITSYALARAGFTVTALEPDASDLVGRGAIERLAARESLPIVACDGTGESIPASSGEFDVVFGRQVLHHARDLRRMCRELHRVSRPGGVLVCVRDHVVTRSDDLPAFLASHPLHSLYGGENAFRIDQYRAALRDAGFRIQRLLRSFDSVINYYPHSRGSLRAELVRRADRVPGGRRLATALLANERAFDAVLALMSLADNRPGRLVSFVCIKDG